MKNELVKSSIGIILIFISAFLVMYGIANNEIATVFNKAVNICMECIGIG